MYSTNRIFKKWLLNLVQKKNDLVVKLKQNERDYILKKNIKKNLEFTNVVTATDGIFRL